MLALTAFLGGAAHGATYFIAADGDWNTLANWSGGLPSSSVLPSIGTTASGGLATALARITADVGGSANRIYPSLGVEAGTSGTVIQTAGTAYYSTLTVATSGTGNYTVDGPTALVNANSVTLATSSGNSVGTFNLLNGASLTATTGLTLGTWGTGTFNQVGGNVTVNNNGGGNSVSLGINSSGTPHGRGIYNLSGDGVLTIGKGGPGGPPLYMPAQGTLIVGSYGEGTFNIGDATSGGTVNEAGPGTLGVQVTVRAQNFTGSAGTIHGWGSINTTGTFTNNGKVQADGYGTDRTLTIASYSSLANGIANPTTGGTNGWFAVNHGKLVLKDLTIASGNSTLYWGSSGNPTLVNALQLSFSSVQTGGTLGGSLLAPDRTDVPTGLIKPVGIWDFTPGGGFNFGASGNVTMKFRYDDALAASLGISETNLKLYNYTGGIWQPVTATIDATNNWLTASGITSFSPLAISAGIVRPWATIGAITSQSGLAVITGGSVPFTFTVENSAATGNLSLLANITAGTNTAGTVAGPIVVTANTTSGAISGLSFNGTTVGLGQTGNFVVTDPDATNNPQTGNVTVDVYDHASGSLSAATLTLPSVHVGYTGPLTSVDSLSAINEPGVRANLKTTGNTAIGNLSLSGNAGGVAPGGSSGPITAGLATGQGVGAISQVFTLTYADDSALNGASGSLGTANVTVTGLVYSGQGVWNTNGSGPWQDAARWTTLGGVPGVDGALSANDTATFGSALSAGVANVILNGVNPTLSGLTFDNATRSYSIVPGTGGNLTFVNPIGITVSVLNGSHEINVPVNMNNDTLVNVANAPDTFTMSGMINGPGGLSKAGNGKLILSGNNTYAGPTNLIGGTLQIDGPLSGPAGILSVGAGATLLANASINRSVAGVASTSMIYANTSNVSLGDPTSFVGFSNAGQLIVGNNTVTINSQGFALLGQLTTLGGGQINAPNGITMGTGANFSGHGVINGKLAAGFGSTIQLTGNLTLGDVTRVDGFYSDGSLLVGNHTVTISDANQTALGSLTQLGDGTSRGTLKATTTTPGFVLDVGRNLIGRGFIGGDFKNNGAVTGDGILGIQRLIFEAPYTVSGLGTFTNVSVLGTFHPGNSPGISTTTNFNASGTLLMEIDGPTPGFETGFYSQMNDSAAFWLGDPISGTNHSILNIAPWNSLYVPIIGQTYTLLTWQTGLLDINTGNPTQFAGVNYDPFYAAHGISFNLSYNNTAGAGSLTLQAVPEPGTLALLTFGSLAVLNLRRKTKK